MPPKKAKPKAVASRKSGAQTGADHPSKAKQAVKDKQTAAGAGLKAARNLSLAPGKSTSTFEPAEGALLPKPSKPQIVHGCVAEDISESSSSMHDLRTDAEVETCNAVHSQLEFHELGDSQKKASVGETCGALETLPEFTGSSLTSSAHQNEAMKSESANDASRPADCQRGCWVFTADVVSGRAQSLNCMYTALHSRYPHAQPNRLMSLAQFDSVWHRIASFVIISKSSSMTNLKAPVIRSSSDTTEVAASIESWTASMKSTCLPRSQDRSSSCSPLAELQFWRESYSTSSHLLCQLELPVITQALQWFGERVGTSRTILDDFHNTLSELQHAQHVAQDNLKYLGAVEGLLKKISDGPADVVTSTLPRLFRSLGYIWNMSRYFNTDEYMEPFLKRIADQICEVAIRDVCLQDIGTTSFLEVVQAGRRSLETWNSSYLKARDEMEERSSAHRWEFDRLLLFRKSGYISSVLQQLANMHCKLTEHHAWGSLDSIAALPEQAQRWQSQLVGSLPEKYAIFDSSQTPMVDAEFQRFLQRVNDSFPVHVFSS
mmetsp:Transcript_40227/g.74617  ORF Transcript_40227/g.74617 Transcript_40227/m.74617 type:complete len:547 (-) Transcript_40227:100-1740(-)